MRTQSAMISNHTWSTTSLPGGPPKTQLFTLLTNDCTPTCSSNHFVKFAADDTTVLGLISNKDESNYRNEVNQLDKQCNYNLSINVRKTKKINGFFQRAHIKHPLLTISGTAVEQVSSNKFLGVCITDDLSWTNNTASLTKTALQCLHASGS